MVFDIDTWVPGVRVYVGYLGLDLENPLNSLFFLDSLACEGTVFIWEIRWRLQWPKKNKDKNKAFLSRWLSVFGKA